MPPTKATSPSTITSFSWWQCIGRSWASRAHWTFVPRVGCVAHHSPRHARGREDRHGCSRPGQHPHLGAIGDVRQQVAQHHRREPPRERELRAEEPPGDVHVRAGAGDLLRDPRQRLRSVDENLERAPGAGRGIARGPSAAAGVEGAQPSDAPEAASMMRSPRPAHRVPERTVRAEPDGGRYRRGIPHGAFGLGPAAHDAEEADDGQNDDDDDEDGPEHAGLLVSGRSAEPVPARHIIEPSRWRISG